MDAPERAENHHRVRASAVGARGRDYSFAFQPIVDSLAQSIYSYEALIRGPRNEAAPRVLGRIPASRIHQFDEEARQVAIELAARLEIDCLLSLNFLPRSLEISKSTVESTLETAARFGMGPGRIILEVSEREVIDDHEQFARLVEEYRRVGLRLAIDDFGAGHSGLNLLADFQPDMVKIDMNLVRGIETRGPRKAIMRAIIQACRELAIEVAAEGVETLDEYHWFRGEGVRLFQGFLFAMPGFECLPEVKYPARG